MFPELTRAVKDFFKGSDEITTLGLSKKGGSFLDFTALEADWYWQNGYFNTAAKLLGGVPSISGETVNLDNALGHSTIYACNRLISSCIGMTPAYLYRQTSNGKVKATDKPMYRCMLYEPNEEISAYSFTQLLTSHALLSGNAFAQIIRRSGTGIAIGFRVLLPQQVQVEREKTGQKRIVYIISEQGVPNKVYPLQFGKPQDILHLRGAGWDGLRGYSVITLGKNAMGTALSAERNLAQFWAHGGRPPYNVELLNKPSDVQKFREDLKKVAANPWDPVITEHWWKINNPQGSSGSMRDAQGIENRMFTVAEMCRWFNVSPPLVHELGRATFNNIEELFLHFKNFTLNDWYTMWEQDFNRCVLTSEEKDQGYELKHDAKALLRGDYLKRMQGLAQGLQNGLYSIDEARDTEDLDALPNGAGRYHHIQLNMQEIGSGLESPAATSAPKNPKNPKGPSPQLVRLEQDDEQQD